MTNHNEVPELADVDVRVQPVPGTELVHLDVDGRAVILPRSQAARVGRDLQRLLRGGRSPRGAGAAGAARGGPAGGRCAMTDTTDRRGSAGEVGSLTADFVTNLAPTGQICEEPQRFPITPREQLDRLLAAVDAGVIAPRVAARLYGFLTLERERPGTTGYPASTAARHRRHLRDLGFKIEDPRTTRAMERYRADAA